MANTRTIFVVSLVFALFEDVLFFIVSKLKRSPNKMDSKLKLFSNSTEGFPNQIKQLLFSRLSNNRSLKAKPFSRNVQGFSFI